MKLSAREKSVSERHHLHQFGVYAKCMARVAQRLGTALVKRGLWVDSHLWPATPEGRRQEEEPSHRETESTRLAILNLNSHGGSLTFERPSRERTIPAN